MTTALEGSEGSASRPGRSLPPRKTLYPLYRMLGGPQGRSRQVRKFAPIGIRSPDRPARSQSLYGLRYPAHKNSSDTIGNRTCDLPDCSAVPQPTAPPRAPSLLVMKLIYVYLYHGRCIISRFTNVFTNLVEKGRVKITTHMKQLHINIKLPQVCCFNSRLMLFVLRSWWGLSVFVNNIILLEFSL